MKAGVFLEGAELKEQCILPVHQDFEELSEEILGFIERMKAKYTVAGATFSVPVSVENDANCAALAEVHMGMPEIAVTLPL